MVALEDKTILYDFNTFQVLASYKTCNNPRGLCAFNGGKGNTVLATLTEREGEIRIT